MAGSLSDAWEKKILDAIFGQTGLAAIATTYIGLHTDSNTQAQRDAGTVSEVSAAAWTNYARAAYTNNTTNWPNASGTTATKQNAVAITVASPTTGACGMTVTSMGIYISLAGAASTDLICHGDLAVSKVINTGDTVQFAINSITITQD